MVKRLQVGSVMKRSVAMASGTIGRPDIRASVTIPMPATRAGPGGTSVVRATVTLDLSNFSAARSAPAPPRSLPQLAGARAPDQAHVEMQKRPADHLAIGMFGDHIVHRHGLGLDQRQEQKLAMPHGHNHRIELFEIGIGVGRIADDLGGVAHHADVASRQAADLIQKKLRLLQAAAPTAFLGCRYVHRAPDFLVTKCKTRPC